MSTSTFHAGWIDGLWSGFVEPSAVKRDEAYHRGFLAGLRTRTRIENGSAEYFLPRFKCGEGDYPLPGTDFGPQR